LKNISCVDGYVSTEQIHLVVWQSYCYWSVSAKEGKMRRIVGVSSMSSGMKVSADDRRIARWVNHEVFSWTTEEYLAAIKDGSFFNSVKDVLDAEIIWMKCRTLLK